MSAPRRRTIARRRALALTALVVAVIAVAVALGGWPGSSSSPGRPALVRVSLGGRTLARRTVQSLRRPGSVTALLSSVPASRTDRRGAASVEYRIDRAGLARALERAVRRGGGEVAAPERPTASRVRVPLVKQLLRDDCEAAALSMVLAYRGRRVGQLVLQSQVAHSKPLDPAVSADGSEVWGDPSLGFVGRADGGGPGGGFGVYQGPIEALAARHGVRLRSLVGARPTAVYRTLLSGRPVMAWVALSDGPFATWQTPAGRTVRVDYGEHAVVLVGVGPDTVSVNDPLSGRRLTWTKAEFERMWAGLGRRALAA
jgi:uncharacterized protein YvpB